MNTRVDFIRALAEHIPQQATFSEHLLQKFNRSADFDRENLKYLTNASGYEGYIVWLRELVRQSGARLIVELGNRYGVSTIALFDGLQADQKLISMDLVKDQRYIPEAMYSDPRFQLVIGDCLDLSVFQRHQQDIPLNIDICFSDTVHTYAQIKAEFAVYQHLLSDEALFIIDDIHLNDKGAFFAEVPYEKIDLSSACHLSGFGVIRYSRPTAERHRPAKERVLSAFAAATEILSHRYLQAEEQLCHIAQTTYCLPGKNKVDSLRRRLRWQKKNREGDHALWPLGSGK